MILKKPYAFLIKHFRLFHLIITILLTIILLQTRNIYKFFNLCIQNESNKVLALDYINYKVYTYILVAILLMCIIRWLLKYKDKPRSIYLFSILYYIVIGMVLFIIFSYLNKLPYSYIDTKTIRLYRDTSQIILLVQYILTIIMFSRGLGFNIKKFNFSKDYEEINIQEEDNEEVEVDIFKDNQNIMQFLRKEKRELGYYFKEFKVIIISILLIILLIIGINMYHSNKQVIYETNDIVGTNNLIRIKNSYYEIYDNKKYIIISFDAKTIKTTNTLNTGLISLISGESKYTPNRNVCSKYSWVGICYKNQYLTNEFSNYILVYETENINIDEYYIIYSETYDLKYKIKLNLEKY